MPPRSDTPHTLHGYSVGRWEGDVLVIETSHLVENIHTIQTSPMTTTVERFQWNEDRTRVRMTGNPALNGRPIARYQTIMVHGADSGASVMIFGGGRAPWVPRARELGSDCDNGIEACVLLEGSAVAVLQAEFGDNGVWSALPP